MSAPSSNDELLIEKLLAHLKAEGYSLRIQQWYPARVRQLLDVLHRQYAGDRGRPLGPHHALLAPTLSALPQATRRGVDAIPQMGIDTPVPSICCFGWCTGDGRFRTHRVPRSRPFTEISSTTTMHGCAICPDCGRRRGPSLNHVRAAVPGLARITCRRGRPRQPHGCRSRCGHLKQCCVGFRRASIEDRAVCLRDFLRHLHRSELTAADLSGTVIGPRIYEHEDIPSALRADEILRVLEVTREDLSPTGLRDYAILMPLAAYGLRAAEIVRLRLEDLDWRREVLRARHSKTGTYSELPLLNEPGEALLGYLEKARPPSTYREIFLRSPAASSVQSRLDHQRVTRARSARRSAGAAGQTGPHAFRHARAVSLLRSGVPLKIIGDVLGHTSAQATAEYLKLATDDLRAIGLELPSGVSP